MSGSWHVVASRGEPAVTRPEEADVEVPWDIWHKASRGWRSCFLVAPIIIGGAASSQVLTKFGAEWGAVAAALLALLAGFFPSIYVALDMDMRHAEIARAANEFTNLRDRFRQTFLIVTHNEELAQMSDRVLHMKDGEIVSN